MRHLLTSAAALALMAGAALAQPGREPGREHGHEHIGKASVAPQVQDRAQDQLRAQAAPRPMLAQGGGPTAFTNQIQGQQPDQGQRGGRERGNWQGRGGAQLAPQQQAVAPQPAAPQENRGNWQGRGNWRAQQQAAAPQQALQDQNRWRGREQGQGGYYGGYYGNRDWQRGYDNRDYRGERYASRGGARDYSTFREFHREFRSPQRFHIGGYRRPYGWYAHRWSFGEFLPRPFWIRDYWLVDYYDYGLPPPPFGTIWVRVNDDALLIDQDTGEIITIAYGVFY